MGGGNSVVAEDINVVINGSIQPGWTNGAGNSSYNYTISGATNELISSSSPYSRLQSTENCTFLNKRIIVKAKRIDDNESYVILYNGYSPTAAKFGYNSSLAGSGNEIYSNDDYIELISDKLSITNSILDFRAKNVKIVSIIIKDDYELILDENKPTALTKGNKTEDVTFKYTPKTGWNTICVPFQLKSGSTWEHLTNIFGSEWQAFTFNSLSAGVIQFSNATPKSYSGINANVPLLVYAPNGDTQAAANPDGFTLSSNVTIAYSNGESYRATTANGVTFQGTYAPIAKGNMPSGSYGITNAGQIVNAGANSSIKGYRAYLTGLGSAGARIMILDDDSDTPTDIGLFKMAVPEAKDVYTLSGQRVQKARKGIYVINGKKIVIK